MSFHEKRKQSVSLHCNIFFTGLTTEIGRVLSGTGAWLRKREPSFPDDLLPFGNESIVQTIVWNAGMSFAMNSTAIWMMETAKTANYICEMIGNVAQTYQFYAIVVDGL